MLLEGAQDRLSEFFRFACRRRFQGMVEYPFLSQLAGLG